MNQEGIMVLIGLEVHVQLKTNTKIFCSCRVEFGKRPNENTCPVCLGLPGVLPVVNEKAIIWAVKTALALNCKIRPICRFHRKNYFYPDLPKSYQISQYDEPIAYDGYIEIPTNGSLKKIRIKRMNLEEDAGKLLHTQDSTLVDLTRCGVPLLEIVTYPDITSSKEAYEYLSILKSILQYIEVSDCDMEKGSLRVDVNVSVAYKDIRSDKVEIKNLNSFKEVVNAINYEIERQARLLSQGKTLMQETRLWDAKSNKTKLMRRKETASDYRYFPEPDLVPITISEEEIDKIRQTLPELPQQRRQRFITDYKLPEYDAGVLTSDKYLADYFEECLSFYKNPKTISNWIMTEILAYLKDTSIKELKVRPKQLAELIQLIDDGKIHRNLAKERVLPVMIKYGESAASIIKKENIIQITDKDLLDGLIDAVLDENPQVVREYKQGKERALNYLLGIVMRRTKGKANPQLVSKLLKEKLS